MAKPLYLFIYLFLFISYLISGCSDAETLSNRTPNTKTTGFNLGTDEIPWEIEEPEPQADESPEPEPQADESPEPEPQADESPEPEPQADESPEPEPSEPAEDPFGGDEDEDEDEACDINKTQSALKTWLISGEGVGTGSAMISQNHHRSWPERLAEANAEALADARSMARSHARRNAESSCEANHVLESDPESRTLLVLLLQDCLDGIDTDKYYCAPINLFFYSKSVALTDENVENPDDEIDSELVEAPMLRCYKDGVEVTCAYDVRNSADEVRATLTVQDQVACVGSGEFQIACLPNPK